MILEDTPFRGKSLFSSVVKNEEVFVLTSLVAFTDVARKFLDTGLSTQS